MKARFDSMSDDQLSAFEQSLLKTVDGLIADSYTLRTQLNTYRDLYASVVKEMSARRKASFTVVIGGLK